MSETIWHLKRCNIFQHLTPEELTALEARCRFRHFSRGSSIYLPSDHADGVLLMVSGRVKISSFTEEGKQAILGFIEAGELFGELALVDLGGVREEHAEATENSAVLLIPADAIHDLVVRHPHVSMEITRLFGLRRKRIERRLKSLLYRSNRDRLVHLLLELAEQYGHHTDHGIDLGIRLSHQDLASVIGSTRETITIILGELQAEGRLQVRRRRIILIDMAGLATSIGAPIPRLGNSE